MNRVVRGMLTAGLTAGLVGGIVGVLPAGAQTENLPVDVPPVTLPQLPIAIPSIPTLPALPGGVNPVGTATGVVNTATGAAGVPVPSVPTDPAVLNALIPLIVADPVGGTCIVVRTAATAAAPLCDIVQSVLGTLTGTPDVAAAQTSRGGGATLPFTGANPWLLGGVAGALVGLGALALGLRSRSRRPVVLGV